MKRLAIGLGALLLAAAVVAAAVLVLNFGDEAPAADAGIAGPADASPAAPAELVARGLYLARAGNCQGCHTARGGALYAGGPGIVTPFGTVFAPNLTPDDATGIGRWSAADFWRALHHGRSRDGRLLYPAFPYPNYTLVGRADADALHAYLRSLPPVRRPNLPHTLRFPFDTQVALGVWRALYFRPGTHRGDAARSAEWNRGAYLVEGLGHCNACHSQRNRLGASVGPLDLGGGLIPVQNWYAPSLTAPDQAGVAAWPIERIVGLLKTGVAEGASVAGPMADVVLGSTQHLSDGDLRAMATFLKSLPASPPGRAAGAEAAGPASPDALERGGRLFATHCAACHGEQGEGVRGIYPALAGNRAVTLDPPANLVHVVLEGGFAPSTAGNPRPFGMPPFGVLLGNEELADLLSYLRGSWGHRAGAVSSLEVDRYRNGR